MPSKASVKVRKTTTKTITKKSSKVKVAKNRNSAKSSQRRCPVCGKYM